MNRTKSCDTHGNASRKKGPVSWKDVFVRQSQNTFGSSLKMEISLKSVFWASVPIEIESVSAIDFVGLTILHFHSVFA